MVEEIARRNEEFLGHTWSLLRVLIKWREDPSDITSFMSTFKLRIQRLNEQFPDDPEEVTKALLQELTAEAKLRVTEGRP